MHVTIPQPSQSGQSGFDLYEFGVFWDSLASNGAI